MNDFIKLLLDYVTSIIPAFLFALLISAILAETIPESFFEKVLSLKGIVFVFLSSVIGALIPLCTCGMIPLASKMQKKGASWLIVISFLTAGNASSITALFMTLVLGIKITLFRFLFSVIFGILVAYIFVLLFKPTSKLPSANQNNVEALHIKPLLQKIINEFFGLLVCFGPWVLAAFAIGAIIALYIKPEHILEFAGIKNLASPFLLAVSGFPFYFCAGTDIPISKALIEKGASFGGILAFMTGSPSINLTSLIIYQKWLGIKNSFIYLAICVLVCGVMGLIANLALH
ncbi:MAG: permease [Candidatus Melainabacteria bacterium]|nr:permease [Candidatus Melainabacteria bacterium]